MLRRLAIYTTLLACGLGASALAAKPAHLTPRHQTRPCQRFAAPWGSDSTGRGTRARPFRSVARLDRALRPGQTGCLRGGTYGSIHTLTWLRTSGQPPHRLTIRSFPGETALVRGWIAIDGSYTTLSRLKIDGSNTFYRQVRPGTSCATPAASVA